MSDDYQAAALRDPCFRFIHSIMTSIGNYPHEIPGLKQSAAHAREKAEAMTDKRWRKAYIGWCDYADRQIAKSIKAIEEGPARRAAYQESVRQREAGVEGLLERSPPR